MVRRLLYHFFFLFAILFVLVSCEETEPDDTDADTGATIVDSLYLDSASLSAEIRYPDRLIAFLPAPNQFANSSPCLPENAESIIGGQGLVSLGGWGGYIIVAFEKAIINDPSHLYGVDFTIVGNAYSGSSEPGIVMVMQDENENGLADDTWYELKGGEHSDSSSISNYELSYYYLDSTTVLWRDNQGNSDTLLRNAYHSQAYYPLAENYPDYPQDSVTFRGTLLSSKTLLNTSGNWEMPSYSYGYADNLPVNYSADLSEPDNPETTEEVEGGGGDAFKLEWAIDSAGQAVSIDSIHFIKIYTGVFDANPVTGDLSTEIKAIIAL